MKREKTENTRKHKINIDSLAEKKFKKMQTLYFAHIVLSYN